MRCSSACQRSNLANLLLFCYYYWLIQLLQAKSTWLTFPFGNNQTNSNQMPGQAWSAQRSQGCTEELLRMQKVIRVEIVHVRKSVAWQKSDWLASSNRSITHAISLKIYMKRSELTNSYQLHSSLLVSSKLAFFEWDHHDWRVLVPSITWALILWRYATESYWIFWDWLSSKCQ